MNFARQRLSILLATVATTLAVFATDTFAAVSAVTQPARRGGGITWIDYSIVAVYLGIVLAMGWYYSRRESDGEDYFIATRKHINPVLVGISLFATLLSTISYLGKPGEMINKGPYLLVGQVVAIPFAYVIMGYFVIPRLMRERVTSAYELLEARLGLGVRLLGASLFVVLRLMWMGMLIYMASVALVVMMGIDAKWTPAVSAVSGMVAVIYTSMGGLRTVVLTDVFQFGLLLFGALLTIGIISWDLGGITWIPSQWSPYWDRQPVFSFDPYVRVTVFGAAISMLVWRVSTAGSDQTAVQRYMATKDIKSARRSYLITEISALVVTFVLAMLGLALLGFFSKFPGAMGPGMTLKKDGDKLFPYFISYYIPIGFTGLLVSAVMAAAMSSIDSGVNSITAVTTRDFLQRFGKHPKTKAGELRFARAMAFGIGTIVVVASLFMQYVRGNFIEMTSKTANLVVTPIFVLFILALWVPKATPLAAWVGAACGLATSIFIGFSDYFLGSPPISFQWMGPAALVVGLSVSLALSWWGPRPKSRQPATLTVTSQP